MKEKKFRAWENVNKEMIYDIDVFKFVWMFWDKAKERLEFLQYTWLKDKNWKEIYEGDIIRLSKETLYALSSAWHKEPDIKEHCEVWYKNWNAMFNRNLYDYKFDSYLRLANKDSEIIGNIYENKDLLNSW